MEELPEYPPPFVATRSAIWAIFERRLGFDPTKMTPNERTEIEEIADELLRLRSEIDEEAIEQLRTENNRLENEMGGRITLLEGRVRQVIKFARAKHPRPEGTVLAAWRSFREKRDGNSQTNEAHAD